ncbi:hypothetical protein G210_0380 [Candida maltosa Xu316]|uniref:Uncharacterized protein n=1 Tax=Candida maltosa (strain Xu316) TaxID=1245528 RepID=M3IR04_CANMX|nr:hypothetical protein G210_0380 [Candida maltosa Xu316]
MSTFITILEEEITYIQDLLQSIPFSSDRTTHFLQAYKLSHQQLMKLNEQPGKFPVDANKLLKLGISLGNLIKTLQVDEESYQHQHNQQRQFLQNLNNSRTNGTINHNNNTNTSNVNNGNSTNSSRVASTISDPFREPFQPPPPKHLSQASVNAVANNNGNGSGMAVQPPYQVKFIKNLVNILKNFDIGPKSDPFQASNNRDSIASNHSMPPHTPQRVLSNGSGASSNTSPIKLNSKQLLIEKLEININLDNLFIYKIILKLILEIFQILKQNLINTTNKLNESSSSSSLLFASPKYDIDESSSIFSSNSVNSQESNLSNDEYYKLLSKILSRVSHGIVQPFIIMIYRELVESTITDDFTQLINSL